jgi:TetR/AcrR family transcriptional repressor of nem operon
MTTERSPKANEIISYTRQLLTSGGYQSFSFADISAKVNIRKASIHHHFPSKAELVKVVVTEYREEARAGMQAMSQQMNDPVAEIQAYVDYWATCIREGSSPFCICAMLAVELPTLPAEVAREVSGHFADLNEWLATLLRRGESEKRLHLPVSPADEASLLMATVHGAMLSARAFNDADIFRRTVQPLIDNIVLRA